MNFKIHWLCTAPSPYNNYLFQTLAADPEIDLLVHFKKGKLLSHPWVKPMAQDFPARFYKTKFGVDRELVGLAIKDNSSLFVLGGWNHPTTWAVLNILLISRRPFIVWTDTPNLHKKRTLIKDKLRSKWLKTVFRNAVAMMGTGRPGTQALSKMGCPEEKAVDFPYWVPLPKDWNTNKLSFEDSIKFFSIGQLIDRKSYDSAIRAIGKIFHKRGNLNIEYWVFGDGPRRKDLERLTIQTGIKDIVKFWGWQEPSFIHEVVKKADVFVHPALWEPYGVVVLEAMALGKPVIASDKTMAAIDRIKDGTNGFIHRTMDIEQITQQVLYFIENPDEVLRMGKEARRTAEKWPVEQGVEIIKGLAVNAFHRGSSREHVLKK